MNGSLTFVESVEHASPRPPSPLRIYVNIVRAWSGNSLTAGMLQYDRSQGEMLKSISTPLVIEL